MKAGHTGSLARAACVLTLAAAAGAATGDVGRSRVEGNAAFDRTLAEIVRLDTAADRRWDSLKTPDDVKAYQSDLRQRFTRAIGGFPERTPLNAAVTGKVKREGYVIEKVRFESRPGFHVTAHLFLPDVAALKPPYPAILVPCGHSAEGKLSKFYQRVGVMGVKGGFATLVYDPIDQGEREQLPGKGMKSVGGHVNVGYRAYLLGWNTAQFRIWDGMRAIDYLQSREDVDGRRIGVMGNSGGGTLSSYLLALDERIQAACPSCYITNIRRLAEDWGPQDCEQVIDGQLALGINHLSLLLMGWPRPVACTFADEDAFPFDGALTTFAQQKLFYNRFGTSEKADYTSCPGPHGWYDCTRGASVEWMKRWLNGDKTARYADKAAMLALNDGFDYAKVDCALTGSEEGFVVPEGMVAKLPGERTAYDIMKDELARVSARRVPPTKELVRRATGIRLDAPLMPEESLDYKRGTYWPRFHSSAEEIAVMLQWIGTSLVARKAEQMIARARAAQARGAAKERLVATGADCVAAAHASFLAPELFDGVDLREPPPSWRKVVEDELLKPSFEYMVGGALRHYDWTDLVP